MHAKQMQALDVDPRDRGASSRRRSAGRPAAWSAPTAAEDAETIVVALGSVLGTIEEVVDELREQGVKIGAARDHLLPTVAARRGPRRRSPHAKRVVVLERAFAVGAGGIVGQNVRLALAGPPTRGLRRRRGARRAADHQRSLHALFDDVARGPAGARA